MLLTQTRKKLTVIVRSPLKQIERRAAIRETWGKDFKDLGIDLAFAVSGVNSNMNTIRIDDIIHTVGTDTHDDLTNRMCRLSKFIIKDNSGHFLFMDDDCSVNVEAFMRTEWDKHDALGVVCGHFISGCAVVYSLKALEIIADKMPRDDVMIGLLLNREDIEFHSVKKDVIRPWIGNGDVKFGDDHVAIQHYVRTPEEIRDNHKLLGK